MGKHDNCPGLCLKQKVRNKELTAQEALDLLIDKEPRWYKQTATYSWLLKHGAT